MLSASLIYFGQENRVSEILFWRLRRYEVVQGIITFEDCVPSLFKKSIGWCEIIEKCSHTSNSSPVLLDCELIRAQSIYYLEFMSFLLQHGQVLDNLSSFTVMKIMNTSSCSTAPLWEGWRQRWTLLSYLQVWEGQLQATSWPNHAQYRLKLHISLHQIAHHWVSFNTD